MKNNWNIALEISPILAASGSFGDKSGVYRVNFNIIKYLSKYFKRNNSKQKIYLYTLSPTLQYNMSIDLYELLSLDNVEFIKGPLLTRRMLTEIPILDKRVLRFFVKKINESIYRPIIERLLFWQYIDIMNKQFIKKKVKIVHHSESGFFHFKHVANVIYINDLIPIKFPFWQRLKALGIHNNKLKFANQFCQGVICISRNTRKDFLKHFDYNKNLSGKTKTIYLGLQKFQRSKSANMESVNRAIQSRGYSPIKKKKYLLYFGTIEPRKNTALLTTVFHQLKVLGELEDFKLLFIGGKGWGKVYDLTKNFITENYPDSISCPIIILDYISDEYLATIIENAYAVVYPSIYEGFGFPITESLQFGIPVITSNTSSMPEAGGNACIYIDPSNPNDLRKAILKLTSNKKLYNKLSKLALKQAAKFSWPKTAKETCKFYQSIIKANSL